MFDHFDRECSQGFNDNLGMVGVSAAMHLLRMETLRMAPLKAPVLIQGESGTGKELVAANLHGCSRRSAGKMVAVNSGALTETMAEDILFGHDRGAFTGAAGMHRGVFERADGGTLFSTRSESCPSPSRRRCFACSTPDASAGSARRRSGAWISGSLPPPTGTCCRWSTRAPSGSISTIGSARSR